MVLPSIDGRHDRPLGSLEEVRTTGEPCVPPFTTSVLTDKVAGYRVVIVGAGFGGLFAAKFLKRAPVEITLVDRTNHHLFQPLLYQVATGILPPGAVTAPRGKCCGSMRTRRWSSATWSMSTSSRRR